jgi:hypothetical protein
MAFIELHSIICIRGLALLAGHHLLIGFRNEERECRSPRGGASIGTLCSGGNSHCVDREFSFSDLALIALAARQIAQRKKKLARNLASF